MKNLATTMRLALAMSRRSFLHAASVVPLWLSGACWAGEKADENPNPFLEGNFAPVREEVSGEDLPVIGKLPPELDGMYVRTGPNPQHAPTGAYHWVEGDGMLHGVRLRDGKASYRNRYVRTASWKKERRAGKPLWGSFLDSLSAKQFLLGPKDTANTALVWHGGKLLALMEMCPPYEVKVPELDTVGAFKFAGKLQHAFTAHPKVDPETGEMLFFGYSPFKPYLRLSTVNQHGELTSTMPIDLPRAVMMHDFGLTPNHVILLDLPETVSLERAARGGPLLKFEPDFGARIGVLPRHGSNRTVKWFAIDSCFVFHTLNAHEDGAELILSACRMKECPPFISRLPEGHKVEQYLPKPRLYRWRINLKQGSIKGEAIDDSLIEFPRINENWLGKKNRYGYTAHFDWVESAGLRKYDLEKGTSEQHLHGNGRFGGEGVFIPRPDAKAEDDGWLATYVHDAGEKKSELVLIDARDFCAKPVARVRLPARVPYGFHGTWIPGNLFGSR